jgi:transcriptional regulator of acetoin/glycerol metabolism
LPRSEAFLNQIGLLFGRPPSGLTRDAKEVLVRYAATTDLNAVARELIVQALAGCAGNKSKAATRLGISRTQVYVRLRRYQLS